jgi:hypothetical protein
MEYIASMTEIQGTKCTDNITLQRVHTTVVAMGNNNLFPLYCIVLYCIVLYYSQRKRITQEIFHMVCLSVCLSVCLCACAYACMCVQAHTMDSSASW